MITDPTALLAFALCIGILGLLVLIMPLLILFWSQMEPQLMGLVANGAAQDGDDEYASQTVLPKLMKSFGDLAEIDKARAAGLKSRGAPKSKAGTKRKSRAASSRSKASSGSKTVKAAPAKSKKSAAKPKAATKAKSSKGGKAVKKARPVAARRTPAGAKRDAVLGVIYSKKPKEVDDLKEIKGVAKVIEAKLHKEGIYTFRQVVEWDAAAIDAFSDKLSFKGRIRNDGWQKQCAKFHKAKYGEKIS